ncbi:hypothetical protein HNP99_000849 [Flavobacterium sp. 28A]|nr:hypothetical protein [Flavobacterium sp. 28A]
MRRQSKITFNKGRQKYLGSIKKVSTPLNLTRNNAWVISEMIM